MHWISFQSHKQFKFFFAKSKKLNSCNLEFKRIYFTTDELCFVLVCHDRKVCALCSMHFVYSILELWNTYLRVYHAIDKTCSYVFIPMKRLPATSECFLSIKLYHIDEKKSKHAMNRRTGAWNQRFLATNQVFSEIVYHLLFSMGRRLKFSLLEIIAW